MRKTQVPLYNELYVGLSAMKYNNDSLISTNYFAHSEGNSNEFKLDGGAF
jgi:hypothetical protein